MSRFIKAATFANNYTSDQEPVAYLQRALDSVRDGSHTKWHIIYNTKTLEVLFQQTNDGSVPLRFNLNNMNFSCRSPMTVTDLSGEILGHRQANAYTPELNKTFVQAAYSAMPFSRIRVSPSGVANLIEYSNSFQCSE